jgi:hypothetical protein
MANTIETLGAPTEQFQPPNVGYPTQNSVESAFLRPYAAQGRNNA